MADLTKRAKAIPTWYYGVGAVGVAGLYFLYSRRKSAKAAAATTSSTQAADMTGTAAGYSSQDLAAVLANMQGAGSTAPGSTASDYTQHLAADYTTPFGEAVSGFGYRPTQGVTSVVGPSGVTYSQVANAKARNALINSGQKVFYQPAPGVFQPYNPATMNKTQTPTFVAVS